MGFKNRSAQNHPYGTTILDTLYELDRGERGGSAGINVLLVCVCIGLRGNGTKV